MRRERALPSLHDEAHALHAPLSSCHHVGGRGSLTKTRTEYSEASSVDAWTGARPQASSRTKPMSRFDIQACMHVSMHISECAMHVCVYIRVCI